ncbi:aquaporin-1-like [Pelmatolapia mariae]|uniref:aquaporin-1-like n=1 Tax=Pelmatolapia mariae TaxID=158779 RepID=UPI002FE5BFA7
MSEIKSWSFWRAVLAECLGMIILIFIGLSAAVGDPNDLNPDREIKVAFAFGLAIATLAECIGHISGAHLNPAITLGLVTSCRISILRALFYMLAQMLGAVVGSAIVYGIRAEHNDSLGVNELNDISPAQGFGIEFMLTLQLVLCLVALHDKRREIGGFTPLAYGFSVTLGHLAGISYTGCGINPARSFGPAVIQKAFNDHWVYWAGPMSAGVVAALLYNYVLAPSDESFKEKTKILLCRAPEQECETEPLLEDVGDVE